MSSPLSPSANMNNDAPACSSSTKTRRKILLHHKKYSGRCHPATANDRGASRRRLLQRIVRQRTAKAEGKKKNNNDEDDDEENDDGKARQEEIRRGKERARSEVIDDEELVVTKEPNVSAGLACREDFAEDHWREPESPTTIAKQLTTPVPSNPTISRLTLRSPPCTNCRWVDEPCEMRDDRSTRCTRCIRRHEKCHDTERSGKGKRSQKRARASPRIIKDEGKEGEGEEEGIMRLTRQGSGRRREERLEQEVLLLCSESGDLRTRLGVMETMARENERRMLSILENMAMGRYPVFANVAGLSGTRGEESRESSEEEENDD